MITEEIINKKYLGIPYKHHGRTLEGLDCYGLILKIYNDLGHNLLDINDNYDERWAWKNRNYFIENYYRQWQIVYSPNIFDVVLFKNGLGVANHGGVILSDESFIHTCKVGTVVSRLSQWQHKLEGFYHLKERVCR